jgi:Zn finger protein HypA/HybF involved in hydrogenase expression
VPKIAFKRRSSFGMNCIQCDNELIAPETSHYRDERHVLHQWRCPKCDSGFDVISPADTKSIRDIMRRIEAVVTRSDVFPSTLVA